MNLEFFSCSFYWNVKTKIGYFGEICNGIMIGTTYLIGNGAPLMLFISMCLHHQAFYKMLRYSLKQLNVADRKQNDEKFIIDIIRFHMSTKRFVRIIASSKKKNIFQKSHGFYDVYA